MVKRGRGGGEVGKVTRPNFVQRIRKTEGGELKKQKQGLPAALNQLVGEPSAGGGEGERVRKKKSKKKKKSRKREGLGNGTTQNNLYIHDNEPMTTQGKRGENGI